MFRRERPQKGRYRQFYQIDVEVFGISSPFIDAQIIFMLVSLFERLEVKDVSAHINCLGCPKCRPDFQKALDTLLEAKKSELCENCLRRSEKNPLRTLDCKVPTCREALAEAPSILDYLCSECKDHFDTVKQNLDKQNVHYEIDRHLVRGLDYYTRTAFEILTNSLGAQNAVAGGGRYDGLVEALGGPPQPAIGFAIGFDRLAEILSQTRLAAIKRPKIYMVPLGETCKTMAFEWVCALNLSGVPTEMDFEDRNLKNHMKRADKLHAGYALILGENELINGHAVLRNMETREQKDIPIVNLVPHIINLIR
jgi:histidyl-tRNA synthetase